MSLKSGLQFDLKYIDELDLENKTVFLRVDFNVPIKEGKILNDARIKASLPTLEYAINAGAKVVLASHLGRPKGKVVSELSLEPVAERLLFYLKKEVFFSSNCEGHGNLKLISDMKPSDVLLLENLRFHPGEEANSVHFAKQLSKYAQVYVNDAFGVVHRAHASVAELPSMMKTKGAGFLLKKEIEALSYLLRNPRKPYVIVVGGAKVSDKVDLLNNLLDYVDAVMIGGAMAYTFLKAQGKKIGSSLIEEDKLDLARRLLAKAKRNQVDFLLPLDHVIAKAPTEDAPREVTQSDDIPEGWMGLDIGPKTIEQFLTCIEKSKTVMWNGPMGVFELEPFSKGTFEIARSIAKNEGYTVVGGGDSVSAITICKLQFEYTHVSTGGGASLKYLEGKTLPGIKALQEKSKRE